MSTEITDAIILARAATAARTTADSLFASACELFRLHPSAAAYRALLATMDAVQEARQLGRDRFASPLTEAAIAEVNGLIEAAGRAVHAVTSNRSHAAVAAADLTAIAGAAITAYLRDGGKGATTTGLERVEAVLREHLAQSPAVPAATASPAPAGLQVPNSINGWRVKASAIAPDGRSAVVLLQEERPRRPMGTEYATAIWRGRVDEATGIGEWDLGRYFATLDEATADFVKRSREAAGLA